MSFSSGNTSNLPLPDQRPLGLDPRRLATDQQARPLPVALGLTRLGLSFIAPIFDLRIDEVKQETKKDDITSGYNYSGSFAALICHGPLDRLERVFFEEKEVWPKGGAGLTRDTTVDKVTACTVTARGSGYTTTPTVSFTGGGGSGAAAVAIVKNQRLVRIRMTSHGSGYTSAPSVSFTGGGGSGAAAVAELGSEVFKTFAIEGFGAQYRIYWGTEGQDTDADLLKLSADLTLNAGGVAAGNAAAEHPGYTGQALLVGINHFMGYNRNNLQNIEVEVARYAPHATLCPSPDVQKDHNLAGVLVDSWRNQRYGLGLPEAYLDPAIGSAASTLVTESHGISPLITKSEPWGKFLTALLEYADAYAEFRNTGTLNLGLVREILCNNSPTALPVLDETCLAEPPAFEALDGYDHTRNLVWVNFTNRENRHEDDAVLGKDPANLGQSLEPAPEILQRPWFTRAALAFTYAQNAAHILAEPRVRGRLRVRKSKRQNLTVGARFKLNWKDLGLCWLYCQVQAIIVPDPYVPVVEIEFEADHSHLNEVTYTAPVYAPPGQPTTPSQNITYAKIFEAPYDKRNTEQRPYLLPLVARPNGLTRGCRIQESSVDIGKIQHFALRGHLDASRSESDEGESWSVIMDSHDWVLPADLTEDEAIKLKYLAIVGTPPQDEWLAIFDVSLLDANARRYSFSCLRERLDSKRFNHASGAEVWFMPYAQMASIVFLPKSGDTFHGANNLFDLIPQFTNGEFTGTPTTVEVTYTDRIKRFWKPRDLSINTIKWWNGPVPVNNGPESVIQVNWTPVSREGKNGADTWRGVTQYLWHIEKRRMDNSLLETVPTRVEAAAGAAPVTIHFPGLTQMKLRLFARQWAEGVAIDSRNYDEIVLDLI